MDDYAQAAAILKAIAHPARLRILNALRQDEECVCHLTALLHQRQAYVSQQLMFLRQAGLIEDRKDGWRVYYHIKNPHIVALLEATNTVAEIRGGASRGERLPQCPCPKCDGEGPD